MGWLPSSSHTSTHVACSMHVQVCSRQSRARLMSCLEDLRPSISYCYFSWPDFQNVNAFQYLDDYSWGWYCKKTGPKRAIRLLHALLRAVSEGWAVSLVHMMMQGCMHFMLQFSSHLLLEAGC
jgi:hypothetical protein